MGKSAVIATHIDSGWGYPDELYDNIDRYLEREEPDSFIYVSAPDRNEDDWDEEADYTIESMNGCLDDETKKILATYDDITVVGGYWDLCHADTWKDLLQEIDSRGGELPFDSHTLRIPFDCVSKRPDAWVGDDAIVAAPFGEDYSEDFLDYLDYELAKYAPAAWIEEGTVPIERDIDPDAGPTVSWTFRPD